MGYRIGDEVVEIEGRIEARTAKAVLIDPTTGPQNWCPKSQLVEQIETGEPGLYVFHVTEWIAKKNGWIGS